MECILSAKVPPDFPRVIRMQREAVEARLLTRMHTHAPPLLALHALRVRRLRLRRCLAAQARVRELTNSHVVHPGLAVFEDGAHSQLRPGNIRKPVSFDQIEGLRAAGWCAEHHNSVVCISSA
jgi:hypothetical protein